MSPLKAILLFGAAVLLLDAAWAALARMQQLEYGSLWWVSESIYLVAGGMAGRSTSLRTGALVGAAVAGIEATLGWALSAAIGPGHPDSAPGGPIAPAAIPLIVVFVTLTGGIMGGIGAWIFRRSARLRGAR
jgi:hypothetical protein